MGLWDFSLPKLIAIIQPDFTTLSRHLMKEIVLEIAGNVGTDNAQITHNGVLNFEIRIIRKDLSRSCEACRPKTWLIKTKTMNYRRAHSNEQDMHVDHIGLLAA